MGCGLKASKPSTYGKVCCGWGTFCDRPAAQHSSFACKLRAQECWHSTHMQHTWELLACWLALTSPHPLLVNMQSWQEVLLCIGQQAQKSICNSHSQPAKAIVVRGPCLAWCKLGLAKPTPSQSTAACRGPQLCHLLCRELMITPIGWWQGDP